MFTISFYIMKTKRIIRFSIIIALLFTVLYLLIAAKPLSKEYQYTPVWKISTSNPVVKQVSQNQKKFHFHLGQTLGYFTPDGDISLYESFPSKVSISDKYYAVYDSNAKNTPFYSQDGEQAGTITKSGYPYFKNDLIYVFLPGGASFTKCNPDGSESWTFEGTIPITAFAAKEKYTAVGFADGTIKVFNNTNGSDESTFVPGGSDYPVILGIDISDDGQYVASISGHNQQRFVLSHREENQQKIIFHSFLDSESPYQTVVHFCNDGKRVLYNYKNNLGIYDINSKKNSYVKLSSKIISVEENNDFVFLLGKDREKYTVSMIEQTNTLAGSFTFTANTAFIHSDNENLYVGKDSSISCILITKE